MEERYSRNRIYVSEQESREQGKIDRQHEIIGLEGEQRLERTTYLRDPHLANDLLLEKERT